MACLPSRGVLRYAVLEFAGTLLFALLAGSAPDGSAAAANGLILAALLYATGGSSLNPLVTASSVLTRATDPLAGLMYIPAQFAGAFAGVGVQLLIYPDLRGDPGCFRPAAGVDPVSAGCWELAASFVFVLVVQVVAIREKQFLTGDLSLSVPQNGRQGPISVGLALTALALAVGPLTGCSVNPARLAAPAAIMRCASASSVLCYLVGQAIGCLLATASAWYLFYDDVASPGNTPRFHELAGGP